MTQKRKIRKYRFHGISYSFILREAAEFLQKVRFHSVPSLRPHRLTLCSHRSMRQPVEETSLISLHLGSGASTVAIQNGQSIDTTMGLTPLEGLPGATRSGSIDPSLVFHYTSDASSLARSSTKELHISGAKEIMSWMVLYRWHDRLWKGCSGNARRGREAEAGV